MGATFAYRHGSIAPGARVVCWLGSSSSGSAWSCVDGNRRARERASGRGCPGPGRGPRTRRLRSTEKENAHVSEDGLESKPSHVDGRDAVIAASAGVSWRDGAPPDYHLSHQAMPAEKSVHHPAGSLADIVERVVQVFEMELSHKKDP